jgi:predicted extracellular nuclease
VVSARGTFQILDNSVDPTFSDTKNRPALAQTFRHNDSGEVFTVSINHFKSKSTDCNDVADPDNGDGQGNCNGVRTAAANALLNWLADDPTGSGDADFLIIGDLNSYAMEDPVTALENAGYSNLIKTFVGSDAYSFVFSAEAGYLDHALASPALLPQVSGITIWHINADEPRALDYNDSVRDPGEISSDPLNPPALYQANAYRAADHDPILIGLQLGVADEIFSDQFETAD